MHRAEADVARFVLHAAPEDLLIDAARRQELALAEHREHEALAEQLQPAGLRGESRAIEDSLQRQLAYRARLAQPAAVGERALSKHVHVTRLVHRLRREEHLHFEEVVIHLPHPSRRRVGCDEFNFGEKGAELAHRALEIVGQRLEFGPWDVAGGAPLARDRLFVKLAYVVGPALGLLVNRESERGQVL